MSIQITKATIDDLEEIQRLNLELFKFEQQFSNKYSLDWTYSEIGQNYFKSCIENGIVFVAKDGDKTVGYICGIIYNLPPRLKSKIAEIENMFVEEEYRSKGVGTKLVEAFIETAKEREVETLKVGTLVNNSKAADFYKKNGFDEHEISLEVDL